MMPQSNGTPIPTCHPDSYLTPSFDCQSWSTMNPSEQMPIPLSYLLPVPGGSKLRAVALPPISTSPASPTTSPDSEGTENLNRPQPLFPSVGLLHPSSTWIPGSARRTWEQQPRVSVPLVMGPLCLCFSITLRTKLHYLSLIFLYCGLSRATSHSQCSLSFRTLASGLWLLQSSRLSTG